MQSTACAEGPRKRRPDRFPARMGPIDSFKSCRVGHRFFTSEVKTSRVSDSPRLLTISPTAKIPRQLPQNRFRPPAHEGRSKNVSCGIDIAAHNAQQQATATMARDLAISP
jgi:hypothetical protein